MGLRSAPGSESRAGTSQGPMSSLVIDVKTTLEIESNPSRHLRLADHCFQGAGTGNDCSHGDWSTPRSLENASLHVVPDHSRVGGVNSRDRAMRVAFENRERLLTRLMAVSRFARTPITLALVSDPLCVRPRTVGLCWVLPRGSKEEGAPYGAPSIPIWMRMAALFQRLVVHL